MTKKPSSTSLSRKSLAWDLEIPIFWVRALKIYQIHRRTHSRTSQPPGYIWLLLMKEWGSFDDHIHHHCEPVSLGLAVIEHVQIAMCDTMTSHVYKYISQAPHKLRTYTTLMDAALTASNKYREVCSQKNGKHA